LATPGYFAAIGIPLLDGRPLGDHDNGRAPAVAVVDRTFVERFVPGETPIGRRIVMSNERGRARTIVGVVGAVRQTGLDTAADPHVYIPHAQNPSASITFVVRSTAPPRTLAPLVRERLQSIDPMQPVYNVRTGAEMVASTVAGRTFNTVLIGVFADLAGLLTLVGLYGLMASWVAESKKELGVRLALGAWPRDVLAMVVGRGVRLTAVGLAAGLPIAIAASGALRSVLFNVPERDATTYVLACLALLLAGAIASYIPARRTLALNPVDSLRGD
jgi:putative ABC transport system permease protein